MIDIYDLHRFSFEDVFEFVLGVDEFLGGFVQHDRDGIVPVVFQFGDFFVEIAIVTHRNHRVGEMHEPKARGFVESVVQLLEHIDHHVHTFTGVETAARRHVDDEYREFHENTKPYLSDPIQ